MLINQNVSAQRMFADKKSPTAYLQCIANIECNITINLTYDYLKSKGRRFQYPCPDKVFISDHLCL